MHQRYRIKIVLYRLHQGLRIEETNKHTISAYFVAGSFFFFSILIYLRILVFSTISISDNGRVVYDYDDVCHE